MTDDLSSSPNARIVQEIVESEIHAAVVAALDRDHDRMVSELIALTEIPAPPFAEEARARAYRDMLVQAGLKEVEIDAIGNVTGIRPGSGGGQKVIAISAHLDTVFPAGTNVTVRRDGDRLHAPGVGDNTRGLATILAYLRALDAAGVHTRSDILVLATVGEEGEGDLRGMRHFFSAGKYRDRVEALICLDGPTPAGTIVCGGTGSKRYKATFRGPGGHSFADFGIVNPMFAAAKTITELGRMALPSDPKTTCNPTVIGGGTSVNAIPSEVTLQVDLRSNSASALSELDAAFKTIVQASCHSENASRSTAKGEITAQLELIGDRPAGETAPGDLIDYARGAIAAFGEISSLGTFSTDANIAMSLGVPAITLTWGGTGGNAHTVEEWVDVERTSSVRGMTIGMTTLLAMTAVRRESA
jgi:tripeptide aminopeptidase